jgi:hypothetical protein
MMKINEIDKHIDLEQPECYRQSADKTKFLA